MSPRRPGGPRRPHPLDAHPTHTALRRVRNATTRATTENGPA